MVLTSSLGRDATRHIASSNRHDISRIREVKALVLVILEA